MDQEAMKQQGVFSWNELATTDVAAAKKFYGELFGWTWQDIQAGEMDYTMVKLGDREVGGMMTIPADAQGMPPAWGSYVTVNDVDASVTLAESLGGKICIPVQDIPDVGRFSVITDPQGAMLSLITYLNKE